MQIDLSAFFATLIAAVAGFIISSTTKDGNLQLPTRLLIVLCVAGIAYVVTEIMGDQLIVKFEEKIEGQWLEVFVEAPNPRQSYSIAYIEYNNMTDSLSLGGYGFDGSGKRLSTWTTTAIVADGSRHSIHYKYSEDIFPHDEAIDGTGSVEFHPSMDSGDGDIHFGMGSFREEYSNYKKVEYEMIRITPGMVEKLLGKTRLEVGDYADFVRAYHSSQEPRAEQNGSGQPATRSESK